MYRNSDSGGISDRIMLILLLTIASLCCASVSMAAEEEEDTGLRKEINDLKNYIKILYNLTAYLTAKLQSHLNEKQTTHICQINPCQNSGICHSSVNSFTCTCPSVFTGPTCNENLNECESTQNPCENGGRCIDEVGGFTCVCPLCPLPFAGRNCQVNLGPCRNIECQNGVSCIASPNYIDFVCSCAEGFNGSLCELDVNMSCQYPGTCAPSSCAGNCLRCRNGFVKDPEDDMRCKYANRNASLIISSSDGSKMISLDILNTTQVIQNEGFVRDTDYNFQTSTLFWTSWEDETIFVYTAPINGEAEKKIILQYNSSSLIYALAVDWVHQHLYCVDSGKEQILVSNFNGTMKKVLFNEGNTAPASIAVNPLKGWMFGCTGLTEIKIVLKARVWTDHEEKLSSAPILQILTVLLWIWRTEDNRLYWSQGVTASYIWSSEFDGSDRKLIFTPSPSQSQFDGSKFLNIATYGKYLYVMEWISKTIYKFNKCNGEELALVYEFESNLNDFKIYDATLQPKGNNLCSKRIGHCSHFCFPVPSPGPGNGSVITTTCACPDGLSLSADQQNCA